MDVRGASVGEQRVVKRFRTLSLASIRLQTGWSRASIGRAATPRCGKGAVHRRVLMKRAPPFAMKSNAERPLRCLILHWLP